MFPLGMLMPLVVLVGQFTASYWVVNPVTIAAAYGFYLIHLVLSLVVSRQRTFRLLLWILVVAVIFNLIGCEIYRHTELS